MNEAIVTQVESGEVLLEAIKKILDKLPDDSEIWAQLDEIL